MKSKKIISEVQRMKSLFGYKKGVVISEQEVFEDVIGAPERQDLAAVQKQNVSKTTGSPEQAIVNQIVNATVGAGTNPNKVYDAVSKITSAQQFWNVNAGLKAAGNKYDFAQIINDEYGLMNWEDVQKIINKLKEWGITATAEKQGSKGMKGNSFKITSTGIPNTPVPPPTTVVKTVFTPNEKFPLKFQQQGEKIKQLQQALDVRNKTGQPNITGKFWTATEAKLKEKASQLGFTYDRNTGVTEAMFNDIINASQATVPGVKPREGQQQLPSTAANIAAATPAVAPNIPASPTLART